jgi:hypothetical protein
MSSLKMANGNNILLNGLVLKCGCEHLISISFMSLPAFHSFEARTQNSGKRSSG